MYINENLLIDNPVVMDEAVKLFWKNGFELKVVDGLQVYSSCAIIFRNDEKKTWLGQLCLIESLEKKTVEHIMGAQSDETPGYQFFDNSACK